MSTNISGSASSDDNTSAMRAIVDYLAKYDEHLDTHRITFAVAETDPTLLDFDLLIRTKHLLIKERIRFSHPERSLPKDKPLKKVVEHRLLARYIFKKWVTHPEMFRSDFRRSEPTTQASFSDKVADSLLSSRIMSLETQSPENSLKQHDTAMRESQNDMNTSNPYFQTPSSSSFKFNVNSSNKEVIDTPHVQVREFEDGPMVKSEGGAQQVFNQVPKEKKRTGRKPKSRGRKKSAKSKPSRLPPSEEMPVSAELTLDAESIVTLQPISGHETNFSSHTSTQLKQEPIEEVEILGSAMSSEVQSRMLESEAKESDRAAGASFEVDVYDSIISREVELRLQDDKVQGFTSAKQDSQVHIQEPGKATVEEQEDQSTWKLEPQGEADENAQGATSKSGPEMEMPIEPVRGPDVNLQFQNRALDIKATNSSLAPRHDLNPALAPLSPLRYSPNQYHGDGWKCPSCGYSNSLQRSTCRYCPYGRVQATAVVTEPKGEPGADDRACGANSGSRVTTSAKEAARLAKTHGCRDAVNSKETDVAATNGVESMVELSGLQMTPKESQTPKSHSRRQDLLVLASNNMANLYHTASIQGPTPKKPGSSISDKVRFQQARQYTFGSSVPSVTQLLAQFTGDRGSKDDHENFAKPVVVSYPHAGRRLSTYDARMWRGLRQLDHDPTYKVRRICELDLDPTIPVPCNFTFEQLIERFSVDYVCIKACLAKIHGAAKEAESSKAFVM